MNIPQIVDKLVSLSRSEECIVLVLQSSSANIRWANTTLTTNGLSDQAYVAVFAIDKGKIGSVITSINDHTDLEALVRQAESKTGSAPKAFDQAPVLAGNSQWQSQVKDSIGSANIDSLYQQLERSFDAADKRSEKLFGYAETQVTGYWLGTSKGLRKSATHQESTAELNLKTPDFKKSVWTGMVSHLPKDLDMDSLFKTLAQKMEWSQKVTALPAGKYETILEPSAVGDLLIYQYWSSAARDADEGRSVFRRPDGKNAVGEKLFGKDINLYSDPTLPNMEVVPFEVAFSTSAEQSIFDNGLDLEKTHWVKDGVLKALIEPRYWATKKGRDSHPMIPNLMFDHPTGPSTEEMIAKTKRGLLVTCLWYIREVDPQNLLLTGLTRDGVFLIEDGKVVSAVNNFRFNMSPVGMLQQTTEIGKSQLSRAREFGDYFTFATMPPLRVENFNMSTVSDAI